MKKKLLTLALALLLCTGTYTAMASEVEKPSTQSTQEEIASRADVIETYYAVNKIDGKLYKRRWNATRNYWVDPYWILVG